MARVAGPALPTSTPPARALIAIAHPDFRDSLTESARQLHYL
jgi:acyl-CoA hydrolase